MYYKNRVTGCTIYLEKHKIKLHEYQNKKLFKS